MFVGKIEQTIIGNKSHLRVPLQSKGIKKRGKPIANSVCLLNVANLKDIVINFNTVERVLTLELSCFPNYQNNLQSSYEVDGNDHLKLMACAGYLECITNSCRLQINNINDDLLSLQANYGYGFANKYSNAIDSMTNPFGITEPEKCSPLQRLYDCNCMEQKKFSPDEYKVNCVTVLVPEGHGNPLLFRINYDNCKLSQNEECLLHNIMKRPLSWCDEDVPEIDNGLINLLLAICYDIRTTGDEANCESAWTRSVLCSTFTNFECFNETSDVIVRFTRRVVSLPLYRSYQLAMLCVRDTFEALLMHGDWIVKQLLLTHEIFETDENEREYINQFYLKDYIQYYAKTYKTEHFNLLAKNLKNDFNSMNKERVELKLKELEREMFKELFGNINVEGLAGADTATTTTATTSNATANSNSIDNELQNDVHVCVDSDDEDDDDEEDDGDNEEDDEEEDDEEDEEDEEEELLNEAEHNELTETDLDDDDDEDDEDYEHDAEEIDTSESDTDSANSTLQEQNETKTSKESQAKVKPVAAAGLIEDCISNMTL